MHRLTNIVVASKGKTQVTHTSAHVRSSQVFLDPSGGFDEVGGIAVVFLHTRRHSQHVGVEDDIQRIHPHLVDEQSIGPFGNFYPTLITRGLTLFIETHHHHRSTIAHHIAGVLQEFRLILLQRDGVDDALSLHTFQSRLDHLPVRRVDHHRHTGDIGLRSDTVQEVHHLCLRIQQTVVHIDIYHEGSVSHLFTGNAERLVVVSFFNQPEELPRTCDVTSFTHIHKLYLGR